MARYDSEPLRLAILGLHRECVTANSPAAISHWVDLIQHYVHQFTKPSSLDRRLGDLWERVSADPGRNWTIAGLAASIHLSEKQFQRLCLRDLGRSPRQQLIWLRMRHAARLLLQGDAKIQSIARQVGYLNPFVFSTTFKRVMGWSPSRYPRGDASGTSESEPRERYDP